MKNFVGCNTILTSLNLKRRVEPVSILVAILVLISNTNHAHAAGTSANTQATATVSTACTIVAQNLAFGNLTLPLSAQTASTSMNVLCSKNAPYTVALAYGGIYGQGVPYGYSGSGGYENGAPYTLNGQTVMNLGVWSSSGTQIGTITIPYSATDAGRESEIYALTGYHTSVSGIYYAVVGGGTSYNYGKMIGVASGDNVAYSIQVPGNPGKVWNNGVNNYTATGTGSSQTIPVVGTLVPAQSGSNYPTPDMYMDTVTATLSF